MKASHQTWHFLLFGGFILEPTGHWKSLANSSMLLKVAITLTLPGLCEPVNILSLIVCGRCFEHQLPAAEIQKGMDQLGRNPTLLDSMAKKSLRDWTASREANSGG